MALPPLLRGFRPGLIGDVAALHGRYYAAHWRFTSFFEAKVASGLSTFALRYDPARDLILSAEDQGRTLGSVTIDGSDPAAPDGLLHLRWFILAEEAQGRGLGRALLDEALAFSRASGRPGVYLWTFDGLTAARRLYDRAGFELVEEHPGDTWGTRVTEQRFVLKFG